MRPLEALSLLAAGLAGLTLDAARHGAAVALWAGARGAGRVCAALDAAAGRVDRRARCAAGPHWAPDIDLDPEDGLCPACAERRDWGPPGAPDVEQTMHERAAGLRREDWN